MVIDTRSPATFWTWLMSRTEVLCSPPDWDPEVWTEALDRLAAVHPGLGLEISEPFEGTLDVIVTAGGDPELFDIADRLVSGAPRAQGWRFISLKPALGFDFTTVYDGHLFEPGMMWFLPMESLQQPDLLGLRIGVPELTPDRVEWAAEPVKTILQTALGERLAARELHYVEVDALPEAPSSEGYIRLPELPAYLAWRRRRGDVD